MQWDYYTKQNCVHVIGYSKYNSCYKIKVLDIYITYYTPDSTSYENLSLFIRGKTSLPYSEGKCYY